MKADLKSQGDEMDLVRSTLDVQAKIIANLVDECDNDGAQRDEAILVDKCDIGVNLAAAAGSP